MRVSRALNLGCHPTIHLNRLELREQLVYHQSLILLRLQDGLDLSTPNGMIQRVQELHSYVMIIIRAHVHIGPHVVTITVNHWNIVSMDSPGT
jgi:hypothetical protein